MHNLHSAPLIRVREGRTAGILKNIVYTHEGARRMSFLRLKFAVFSINSSKIEE